MRLAIGYATLFAVVFAAVTHAASTLTREPVMAKTPAPELLHIEREAAQAEVDAWAHVGAWGVNEALRCRGIE